jgi:hypothetical protein
MSHTRVRYVLDNPWRFIRQVVAGFRANQGLLLAGATKKEAKMLRISMVVINIQGPQRVNRKSGLTWRL